MIGWWMKFALRTSGEQKFLPVIALIDDILEHFRNEARALINFYRGMGACMIRQAGRALRSKKLREKPGLLISKSDCSFFLPISRAQA